MEAGGPSIGRRYQPQQENLVVLVTFTIFYARCSGGEGAQDHSYGGSKGHISPVDTVEASGPTIGRRYQPQQENLVVLVTFTIFYARCSVGGRRPISQLRVEQGSYLTAGECGSGRADDWTSLQATTRKLGCFGYIHDLLRSLFGWGRRPRPQLRGEQGSFLTAGHCGSGRAGDWTSLPATTRKLGCFGYIHDLLRSLLGWGSCPISQLRVEQGSYLTAGQCGSGRADD
jgi:hypothetical protein